MRLGLKFRDNIASKAGQFVVEELDSLVAGIRGSWGIEHTEDGRHGDVTAWSVVATGEVRGLTARFETLSAGTFTADSFVASGSGLPARGSATDIVWVDSVGALRRGTLVDTDIPDLPAYAKLADNETISGQWTFNAPLAVNTTLSSHLIPTASDTYDLGSPTKLWNQGYLAQLNAVLFAKETASLYGGWLIVGKNAGTFAARVGSGDGSIDFGVSMTPGHWVLTRAVDEGGTATAEWFLVGSLVSGTRYNVTRNLSGLGLKDWPQGTAWLLLGTTGDGRVELSAYTKPMLSVLSQGATYGAATDVIRLGYLDGINTVPANKVGLAIGDPSGSHALTYYDGVLTVKGAINVTASSSGYGQFTDRPTSLANVNAGEGSKLSGIEAGATVGATWGSNLSGIPGTLAAPSGSGLFLSSTHLGYYTASTWTSYIKSDGTFKFYGASDKYIEWTGSALNIRGTLNASDITLGTLSADRIGAGSITIGQDLSSNNTGQIQIDSSSVKVRWRNNSGSTSSVFLVENSSGEGRISASGWYLTGSGLAGISDGDRTISAAGTLSRLILTASAGVVITSSGGLLPDSDAARPLGSSSYRWSNVFLNLPAASSPNYVVTGASASSANLGYVVGYTGNVSVRKGDDSGALTLTFVTGILTGVA